VRWRPGGASRAARGQLVAREIAGEGAVGGAAVKQRGRGERKTMRTYPKFSKSARGSL
jgi:hypothetical protein